MRRVLHGDVVAAACALLAAPGPARPELIRHLIAEAELADAYRLKTGRAHPVWGSGSLMAAAMARPRAREPYLDDPDYAACLVEVFEALIARN